MAFLSQNCKRRASPKGQLPRRGLLARFARIERRLPDGDENRGLHAMDSSGTRPIPLKDSFRLFRRLLHQKAHLGVGSLQING